MLSRRTFELMTNAYIVWIVCAGYDKFADDISMMLGQAPNNYWKMCWKFISPIVIIVSVVLDLLFHYILREPTRLRFKRNK